MVYFKSDFESSQYVPKIKEMTLHGSKKNLSKKENRNALANKMIKTHETIGTGDNKRSRVIPARDTLLWTHKTSKIQTPASAEGNLDKESTVRDVMTGTFRTCSMLFSEFLSA
jgi:Na+-translocating ferredoxin:NAD+ oxidoreductase RnfG subunit